MLVYKYVISSLKLLFSLLCSLSASTGHLIRSVGSNLRKKITDTVTPEDARDNWAAVTDMTNAKRCETIQVMTIN